MTALAEPFVFLAGRPAAQRAADARAGRLMALLFIKLAVWSNNRIVGDRSHAFCSLNSLFFGKPLRFFPITRTFFPRSPAYLIAMPNSVYSLS
jgi:hypothetical protein